MKKATHDPNAVLPYEMDWSAWATAEGDTVSTATVTITPSGSLVVASSPALAVAANVVTWWMSGGTAGTGYQVTVRVVTTGGRTDDRTIPVECAER